MSVSVPQKIEGLQYCDLYCRNLNVQDIIPFVKATYIFTINAGFGVADVEVDFFKISTMVYMVFREKLVCTVNTNVLVLQGVNTKSGISQFIDVADETNAFCGTMPYILVAAPQHNHLVGVGAASYRQLGGGTIDITGTSVEAVRNNIYGGDDTNAAQGFLVGDVIPKGTCIIFGAYDA